MRKNVTSARILDDNEYVILDVENGLEFDEMEEMSAAQGRAEFSGTNAFPQENQNTSATVKRTTTEPTANANTSSLKEDSVAVQNKKDQEELEVVTKKIAGETFALVKELMQESGLFDAASLIKSRLGKDPSSAAAKEGMMAKQVQLVTG